MNFIGTRPDSYRETRIRLIITDFFPCKNDGLFLAKKPGYYKPNVNLSAMGFLKKKNPELTNSVFTS